MIKSPESYGFSGILLNRRGYEDTADEILNDLETAEYPLTFEQGKDNEWVFIRLNLVENPELSDLTHYRVTKGRRQRLGGESVAWANAVCARHGLCNLSYVQRVAG